jgi:hypothetical protein
MQTTRVIPVVQNDFRISSSGLLKTSVFYDYGRSGYEDPDTSFTYVGTSQQWGFQSTYLTGDWKLGFSGKQVSLETEVFSVTSATPQQTIGNLQVSRDIQFGSILVEPLVQGVWITGLGLLPQGSLGARKEWDGQTKAIYTKGIMSRRVPTLLDRYGRSANFIGNPDLQTELDWTGVLGGELKGKGWESGVQGYAQLRQNARVLVGNSVSNLEDAQVFAVTGKGRVSLSENLDLSNALTYSQSKILATGNEFPYVPALFDVVGFSVHSAKNPARWEWNTAVRFSSTKTYSSSSTATIPGYGVVDTGFQVGLGSGVSLAGRVENVFNRSYELIKDYPIGRIASLSLSGEF